MIIRVLELKGEENDSKRLKNEKVRSMPRHSGLHVMVCAEIRIWQNQACRSMQWSMPWHAWMQKLAVYSMPQHAM